MAVNLTAIFRVRDRGTSQLRRITQMMERMNRVNQSVTRSTNDHQTANRRLSDSMARTSSAARSASTSTNSFATQVRGLSVGTNGASMSLRGMQSTLLGLASAYLTAQGAAKAFDATIGAAARYEQAEVAVKAIFNDDKKSSAYLDLVDKMAIDSPLLNSGEMLGASKTLVAMTKNVDDLGKAWSIIERLMVLDPTQGTDGAAFALKEMWQGDALSMIERFGLNKGELNEIKKMSIPKQISEINKMLDKMGITQNTVNAMGETTLGYWAQIQERADKFLRQVGNLGNSKLGDTLGKIVESFDNMDLDGIASKLDAKLASMVDKAISFGKFVWKWREPIAYTLGALTAAMGAFAVVGVIAALANPISLIAGGIAAAVVGVKALYDNSELFRGAVDGIITKVKSLVDAFKTGGTTGLIGAIFPPGVTNVLIGGLTKVSDFVKTFKQSMQGGLFTGILDRDKTAVALAVGLANGIKTTIEKVSDFVITFKQSLSGGLLTGILDRDKGAVAKAVALANGIKTTFAAVKDFITEKVTQIQPTFERLKEAFSQAFTTVASIISNVWTVIAPYLSGLWNLLQILGDVAVLVFNNVIAPAISFIAQLFSTLWAVAQPVINALAVGFELLSAVIKFLWDNVLSPLVAFILNGVKNAFDEFSGALSAVQGWFESLSGWVSTAYGHVRDFASFISSVKVPDWISKGIGGAVSFVGKMVGAGDKGGKNSHYSGLDSVPYDGYSARLHKGERVLTARENRQYSQSNSGPSNGDITIAKLADQIIVREDADVERITDKIVSRVLELRGVTE